MRKIVLLGVVLTSFGIAPLSLQADIWTIEDPASRVDTPESARFRVDENLLLDRLSQAPHEILLDRSVTLDLPMPDGTTQRFSIVESPIVPDGLTQKFPGMKTFKLHGVDDRAASGRADNTSKGFRAMLQTPQGVVFIDPEPNSDRLYKSYFRRGASSQPFICGVHGRNENPLAHVNGFVKPSNRLAGNYQTYRIAVAATQEYVEAVGGSKPDARAEITTAINRINQVYETTLGIRLLLVGNNGDLLEEENDDCFSNNNLPSLLAENQVWIDATIGSSAYDIGHVFATTNGGLASLGSACQNGRKAQGGTGLPNPTGDPFYIDFVAHEIGHQLNANHTFNGTTLSCGGGNRNGATAYEPGSGSTIMAYTGICGAENLQLNSDATLHAGSIAEIDTFTAAGGSCHGTVANGNTDPTVTTPLANLTIPAQTPFRLEVTAADADLDTLVYQWEQIDIGQSTNSATFGTDLGSNTLFRSYAPQSDFFRDFPALGTQLLGQTDKAEVLPDARSLDFRVTVLDGNSGQVTDDITLTVVASSGFQVTSDGAAGGTLDTTVTPYTITWDTANTENAPFNCANVDIDLLTFDDMAYTNYTVHQIVPGVPNTGSADIAVTLASSHPRARIRIKCSSSVFYDISDDDVAVVGTAGMLGDTAFTTFFNSDGLTVSRSSPKVVDAALQTGGNVVGLFANANPTASRVEECLAGGGSSGSVNGDASAADFGWLTLLGLLAGLVKLRRRYGLQ